MSEQITHQKLLKYGAVAFVPESERDNLFGQDEWLGQKVLHFEVSDELPGFLVWFALEDTKPGHGPKVPAKPKAGAAKKEAT